MSQKWLDIQRQEVRDRGRRQREAERAEADRLAREFNARRVKR